MSCQAGGCGKPSHTMRGMSTAIADGCRELRNLSFPRNGSRVYVHQRIGFNYRMNNVQGALGLAQLERIEELVGLRRAHARRRDASSSLKKMHPAAATSRSSATTSGAAALAPRPTPSDAP